MNTYILIDRIYSKCKNNLFRDRKYISEMIVQLSLNYFYRFGTHIETKASED